MQAAGIAGAQTGTTTVPEYPPLGAVQPVAVAAQSHRQQIGSALLRPPPARQGAAEPAVPIGWP